MSDEEIIAELTEVRGIGRWTAEMFLIFNLLRPDVFPLDDLAEGHPAFVLPQSKSCLEHHAQAWRKLAAVALGRHLVPVALARPPAGRILSDKEGSA
jgi:3-methyladenine DNA glycosylase/8-oxoguanine DNA glycosylase